jgi:ketosteroid isomerase-like protein
MASLEERIQMIEDKDAIRELTAKYCYAVVAMDSKALINMFTEDGVFDMPPNLHFEGREELARLYTDKIDEVGPKPFIQNHVININGDEATGNCAVEIRLIEDGKAFTACGHYNDTYRKVNGEWKFTHRDFQLYHWVPLAVGWAD